MQEVLLKTGYAKSSIYIGEGLTDRLHSLPEKPVLLVDENVMKYHPEKFRSFKTIVIPQGEENKSLEMVGNICRQLVNLGIDRSSRLVGVGGGLTTDIAGFVASTYMRGIRFGFISTTLLGQVDASIGGKNGVNLDGYKNMIGVINQPEFIWCDIAMLRTLEEREYRSGIAEIIKYGAIRDHSLLNYVKENIFAILNRERTVIEKVITRCAEIKAEIVTKDEKEKGERRILNFGHTIGHAIERNFRLLHGEAISIGMVIASELSFRKGLISVDEVKYLHDIIERSGLPVALDFDAEELFDAVKKDKKKEGEEIHFIFLRKFGEAFAGELGMTELRSMLYDLRKYSE